MTEGSNVRLVRCPKCDNLLPELLQYSVYQCGGCGTILRAKERDPRSDLLSEKSDDENILVGLEKSESSAENGRESLSFVTRTKKSEESDTESNWRRKERVSVDQKASLGNRGFQRTEKDQVMVHENISGDFKNSMLELSVKETEYVRFIEPEVDQWTPGANRRMEINGPNFVYPITEERLNQRRKEFVGSMRTRPRMDWSGVERGGGLHGSNSLVSEHKRAPNFPPADEGPSNYYDPYTFRGTNVPIGVKHLEQERAELLQKLDELKDQLSRSYLVSEKPLERESSDRPRPYVNQAAADHFANRPNVNPRNFYPNPPMTHHRSPYQYPHTPNEYYTGRHRSFDIDPLEPYLHDNFFHAPTCSCMSCYDQNLRVHPRVPQFQGAPVNPNSKFYRHEEHIALGPQGYRSPRSRDPHMHMKWPGELGSERDVVASSKKIRQRRYRPVAGGAPFIVCQKCFELLKLPRKKLRLTSSYRQRLRCGTCSAVFVVEFEGEKTLIISYSSELKPTLTEDVHSSPEVLNDSIVSTTGSFSEDHKKSSFNFRSSVTEQILLADEENLNSDESENNKNKKKAKNKKIVSLSPSVSSSREEVILLSSKAREEVCESAEFPVKTDSSLVPPRSPMWQELDSPRVVVGRYGNGNSSKRSENENDNNGFDQIDYRESSLRNEAEATELDVSFDEYQHMSQDFADVSREDYRIGKGSDSFLVGFIKKSLRDFSRSSNSMETEKPKVYINGHPLRDRVVKSAEMYAGPIRPGDYWYDYKAGFWGVMGQSCLGIIPPGIEEFNYPMPTNCGAGNTGVYVNGRELNQRDLDLLASRGLPTMSDKFYIVEINGKVFDEATGKEVQNLGKLAPTVERAKHGFGMKVPRPVS